MVSSTPSRRRPSAWLGLVFGTNSGGLPVDGALVVARAALAWIFIYYGAAKLFGAFPGAGPHGIHQTSLYFAHTVGLHPGGFFAVLGGLIEFGGGIAMAVGLCARLAGLALFGDMVVATITVTWTTGINSITSPPGYQLNIALAALALVITLVGAGRLSLDALVAQRLRSGKTGSVKVPSRAQQGAETNVVM